MKGWRLYREPINPDYEGAEGISVSFGGRDFSFFGRRIR